jgi:hypothetical protein
LKKVLALKKHYLLIGALGAATVLGGCGLLPGNAYAGGPSIQWPIDNQTEPLCPPQCDRGLTCLFHQVMCSLGLWH